MPFKKGLDPNRNVNGRPKVSTSVAELARSVLERVKKGEKPKVDKILDKFAAMAEEGSAPHAGFIFGYAYGKPQENVK